MFANPCMFVELIDKCVGSKIWVVMKGDKGVDGCASDTSPFFPYLLRETDI